MIDRKKLLERNSPTLTKWDFETPLSVGNGELAFTADITGLQTFYKEQEANYFPLCTMSQWGWHSSPAGENRDLWYSSADFRKTAYESINKGTVYYPSEIQKGDEDVYKWLRENPHRMNLARIGFLWEGQDIHPCKINNPKQHLYLQEGILISRFEIDGYTVETTSACAGSEDVLGFSVKSAALKAGKLSVLLAFPYGNPQCSGSDWEHDDWHQTRIVFDKKGNDRIACKFYRTLDNDSYVVGLEASKNAIIEQKGRHVWHISADGSELKFTVGFGACSVPELNCTEVFADSRKHWEEFWSTAGMVDLHESEDERAGELERRIVLSEYLLTIQSLGSLPPQETGLTCNSWYGKFHLEMHLWHSAWAALWNLPGYLKKSLSWYREHLLEAKENAACNGYKGARWQKMITVDGMNSPSPIGPLLIWQQPHILMMLFLVFTAERDDVLLREYWDVIRETARFMCDFVVFNDKTGYYDLPSPLIPAQENHNPRTSRNPAFELEYWKFALQLADDWAQELGYDRENWSFVASHMARLPEKNGLYLACEDCLDTFTLFNRDHPSMTAALGLLPGIDVDPEKMRATLEKVLETWKENTMWGWDFAMLAMTAVRLHEPETAVGILLKDTPKNTYVASGNNRQVLRKDLPLYLPGNGSLLLAVAMMTAGYKGCAEELPGFPKNGKWKVRYENITPFPY